MEQGYSTEEDEAKGAIRLIFESLGLSAVRYWQF
jgi:hypothetical protein